MRPMFSLLLLLVASHQACLTSFPAVGMEQLKGSGQATEVSRGFLLAFSRARHLGIHLDFSRENHRATDRTLV